MTTSTDPTPASHRGLNRLLTAGLLGLMLCSGGCAAFHPLKGIPAGHIPREFQQPSRSGKHTIAHSLLAQTQPPAYLLDTGDVLGVYIEGVLGNRDQPPPVYFPTDETIAPSLGYPIPVRENGTLSLPLLPEPIPVRGLTVQQAEERIRLAYQVQKILKSGRERVLVSLQKPRTYRILVLRQEEGSEVSPGGQGQLNLGALKRGTGHVVALPAYQNDVLNALAKSNGLPGLDAENAIYIIRAKRSCPPPPTVAQPWYPTPVRVDEEEQGEKNSDSLLPPPPKNWNPGQPPTGNPVPGPQPMPSVQPYEEPQYPEQPGVPPLEPMPQPVFPEQTLEPMAQPGRYQRRVSGIEPSSGEIVQVGHQVYAGYQYPQGQPNYQARPISQPTLAQPYDPSLGQPYPQPMLEQPYQPAPSAMPYGSPVLMQPAGPDCWPGGHAPLRTPDQFFAGIDPTVNNPDVIKIPVRLAPGEMPTFSEADVILYDGDIVFIESRETEIFYTGGLLGGGQYTLPRDYDLDILGAISLAQSAGTSQSAGRQTGGVSALNQDVSISASQVVILRTLPNGAQVPIKVDLYDAVRKPHHRVIIQPGDFIILQYTPMEAMGAFLERHLLEGAIWGVATGWLQPNDN